MRLLFSSFAVLGAFVTSGCLQSTYHVEQSELDRLAQLPPEQRGSSIRGVQELSTRGRRAPRHKVHRTTRYIVDAAVEVRIARSRQRIDPPARTRSRRSRGGERPAVRRDEPGERPTVAVRGAEGGERPTVAVRGPEGGERPTVAVREPDDSSGGSGRSGGGDGELSSVAVVAIAIVATAAVATGVLAVAAVEGTRYDGYLRADPKRPIHLYRRDGQWLDIPLYALEPELAEWADGAILDDEDHGEPLLRIGRAPLDRRGLSMGLETGLVGVIAPDGRSVLGGGARFLLGGFPSQYFGLYGLLDFGAREGIVDVRYGFQAQAFAPALGPVSFGAYLEGGGVGLRADDPLDGTTDRRRTGFLGGGGLLQLDVNTRLGLTLRGGAWGSAGRVVPEVMLGLHVF